MSSNTISMSPKKSNQFQSPTTEEIQYIISFARKHVKFCSLSERSAAFDLKCLLLAAKERDSPISKHCFLFVGTKILERLVTLKTAVDEFHCSQFLIYFREFLDLIWADEFDKQYVTKPKLLRLLIQCVIQLPEVLLEHVHDDNEDLIENIKSFSNRFLNELCELVAHEEYLRVSSLNRTLMQFVSRHDTLDDVIKSANFDECPGCFDFKFSTDNNYAILVSCPHILCGNCFSQLMESGMNTCPVCSENFPDFNFSSGSFRT